MTLQEYFGDWLKVIDEEELARMGELLFKLYKSKKCYPDYKSIFKVFNITPYDKLHTIIIGQDPYPNEYATGIAFGNNVPSNKDSFIISPSLKVLEEAIIDYESPDCLNRVFDYSLESWCKQGMLLLNTALTVEAGKPESHCNIWTKFTINLIKNLSTKNNGLIWVLLGNNAKSYKRYIKNGIIIEERHPSYYARNNMKMDPDFFKYLKSVIKDHYSIDFKFYTNILD